MDNSMPGKKMIVLWVLMLLVYQIGMATAKSQRPNQIFLSFRGNDTRKTFASHTYAALKHYKINVFMDDESTRPGHDFESTIGKAINNSIGAVIIFSKIFASSRWCLDELTGILGRKKELGSNYVLSLLYVDDLKPDDIYDERGSYGEALAKYKNHCSHCNEEVEKWRTALKQAAAYAGRILEGKKEADFINEVVEGIREECKKQGIRCIPRHPFLTAMEEFIETLASVPYFNYAKRVLFWVLISVVFVLGISSIRVPLVRNRQMKNK